MTDKTIVFDLGGVLLDWDPRYLYRKIFREEAEMETFLAEICTPAWNGKMDAGLTFQEGIAQLMPQYPQYAAQIEIYHTRWTEMLRGEIPGSVAILRELKETRAHLAGLSNWSEEKFDQIRGSYPFLDWFDPLVISGSVGVKKPEAAIYRILLQALGISAQDCVFIDDMPENIAEAKRQGFDTIHFGSPEVLRDELAARGLLSK